MTPLKTVIYLTFFILERSAQVTNLSTFVHQEKRFISVNIGDNITLQCFSEDKMVKRFFWYKQLLGQRPRLMSTLYASMRNFAFYDEWKNNPRFTLDTKSGGNHLVISDLHMSDTATYYCASSFSITFEFLRGVLVSVKSSGLETSTLIHQSESKTLQSGGSVTLNCTVQTGTCDGEHSVYWFRTSEGSQPGLLYTNEGRNDQCVREPNQQTCVYNLPVRNVNGSHDGIYYCAVVSCGQILFGNGTQLEIGSYSLFVVYFLSGALAFTTILTISLAVILVLNWKQSSCHCRETSARSTTNAQGNSNEDDLHYAALRVNKPRRSGRHRDVTESVCVYSGVRQ